MKTNNYQHLSAWRLTAYIVAIVLLLTQWAYFRYIGQPSVWLIYWWGFLPSWLFISAVASLCHKKWGFWVIAIGLLSVHLLNSVNLLFVFKYYDDTLGFIAPILSALTLIGLFAGLWLNQRETHTPTKYLAWGVNGYLLTMFLYYQLSFVYLIL